MATKKEEAAEGKVKVLIPKLRKEDKDVFVCVNGKGILIKRGEEVLIDPEYAEVLKHSQQADQIAMEYMMGLEDKSE